jgi:tRNA pseudouridine55 synthase
VTSGGILVLDKPAGVSSFAMVKLVRRLTGVRRVGHAGTLDPMATGVLPVAVGFATRLIEYTETAQKAYTAAVRLGIATNTYDAEGDATAERDASLVSEGDIRSLLPRFVGEMEQRPPAFSALKVAGRPLYRYAREGKPVSPAPRRVRVDSINLVSYDPGAFTAVIDVRCGKGTYVRSLAHDLGQALGCGAHLAALRRTETAGFTLAEAHTPEDLVRYAAEGSIDDLLLAADRLLEAWPAAIIGAAGASAAQRGRDLALPAVADARLLRAYSTEGDFVGVLEQSDLRVWHPKKVLLGA